MSKQIGTTMHWSGGSRWHFQTVLIAGFRKVHVLLVFSTNIFCLSGHQAWRQVACGQQAPRRLHMLHQGVLLLPTNPLSLITMATLPLLMATLSRPWGSLWLSCGMITMLTVALHPVSIPRETIFSPPASQIWNPLSSEREICLTTILRGWMTLSSCRSFWPSCRSVVVCWHLPTKLNSTTIPWQGPGTPLTPSPPPTFTSSWIRSTSTTATTPMATATWLILDPLAWHSLPHQTFCLLSPRPPPRCQKAAVGCHRRCLHRLCRHRCPHPSQPSSRSSST